MAKQRSRAGRRRRTRAQWEALVHQYEASGTTQEKFAMRRGLAVGTLRYWLWKLRDERQEHLPLVMLERVA